MALPVLDTSKNWSLHFGSLAPNELPLKMQEKDGVVTFDIFLDPERTVKVELLRLNEEQQIIEGKYSIASIGAFDSVIFQIQENGNLVARPTGMLERSVWTLTSTS